MQRHQRLRSRTEFAAVYGKGRSLSNQVLAARILPSSEAGVRFGFAVSKRVGNAVKRNQVKRRLRDAARRMALAGNWDIVVVARPPAATASFAALQSALDDLLRRSGVLKGRVSTGDA
jgi:ribonuclease P protein component